MAGTIDEDTAMLMSPLARRSTVWERPDGLEVRVPAHRNLFVIFLLAAWLAAWASGSVGASTTPFAGPEAPKAFLLVWLLTWMLAGAFAACTCLWMLGGRERIVLSAQKLRVGREVFGLAWTREYDLSLVKNFRVSTTASGLLAWSASARLWGLGGGPIAFDYGTRTVRMAASIDEPEATQIVNELKARQSFGE